MPPAHDPLITLHASTIGSFALAAGRMEGEGKVIGSTSRGLFLLNPGGDSVIFLSFEPYRSPHTITFRDSPEPLRKINTGEGVRFTAQGLLFPSIALAVSSQNVFIWHAPEPVGTLLAPEEIQRQAVQIAARLVAERPHSGFAPVLQAWMDPSQPPAQEFNEFFHQIDLFNHAARSESAPAAAAALAFFLGLGRGLTPSGDDLITGFLLAASRWPSARPPTFQAQLSQIIQKESLGKTTTLSANIIASAAQGQADERLIALVDGLHSGSPPAQVCAQQALDYGSSSGIDAFVGMLIHYLPLPAGG